MTDESKLRFLDARLDGEGLQGLLKGIMDSEDYGKNAVEIVQNVDIQSIDALTGYKGNRKEYYQFIDSNGKPKLQSKDTKGETFNQTLFAPTEDEGRGATIRAYPGAVGMNMITDGEWSKTLEDKIEKFSSGEGSPKSSAINKESVKRVREFMAELGKVFGFNTPEDQEMFVAAWLSSKTTTRLSGIPGTGKTTLIECAGLLFGNSYGYQSEQNYSSKRNAGQKREWEETRFSENAYRYPFAFLLNKVKEPVSITTNTIKWKSREFLNTGKYGVAGCLDNEKFVVAEAAFKDGYLLLANTEGECDSEDSNQTRHKTDGWFRWPPDDGDNNTFAYYKVISIADVLNAWKQGADAKDGTEAASDYAKAQVIDPFIVELAEDSQDAENARKFIGKWYYDFRIDKVHGEAGDKEDQRHRIDFEMRNEIGIAKVDKDKRAEQLLYGVDISSVEDTKGGLDYKFQPFPRPIVTQPIKFFNEVNRSQAGVEDAILGLIAEGEVEYRGEVFQSPKYTAFMDTNPHVGGNDLAFTDRIDMELLFPSALLDQRYKILQGRHRGAKTDKPRQRILNGLINGQITPMRYYELKQIWKNVEKVEYQIPGYNALMDISIISTLFAQRFGVHEPVAEVTLDFPIPSSGESTNVMKHLRNSGNYEGSLIPLNSSGYFLDASLSESRVYRTELKKSRQAIARGHGAMALMERVLAMRFTNSLAKLSRSLAYLRGNQYVTRKEVMDCLPYVVGHRMGKARGDGGQIENGLNSDAATAFSSGQEFVREAIIKGYIGRAVDSFGSLTMGNSGTAEQRRSQNRWVEWDSMLAQAREDLISSRTYPEYEMKMWAMARMASGDGDPAQEAVTGTGDPMPYLIYRLVLMEELTSKDEELWKNLSVEMAWPTPYSQRIQHYEERISDMLTTLDNYSANDVGILRRRVTLDRWLTIDSKRTLLNQIDGILDSLVGFQIPDNFGTVNPATELHAKVWGLYSACPQQIPEDYRNMGLLDTSKFIGFPQNDFIRNPSWYGGSDTGRASKILYVGAEAALNLDAYLQNKTPVSGGGDVSDVLHNEYSGATYPTASKRHLEQTASLAASVTTDDQLSEVTITLSSFLEAIKYQFDAGETQWVKMGNFGSSPPAHDWDTLSQEIESQIEKVRDESGGPIESDYMVELDNEAGNYSFKKYSPAIDPKTKLPIAHDLKTEWDEAATALINSSYQNKLRFYISVRGNATTKYVQINFCLASLFVTLDSEGNLKPVALTTANPLGVHPTDTDSRYESLASTVSEGKLESFFDLGNITRNNVIQFRQCVEQHLFRISPESESQG
jgi:hypothetical protein